MKILYSRISSANQNIDRQRIHKDNFDKYFEDTSSGAIPFFDRKYGKEIKKLILNNKITSFHVLSIDRLGRNLQDILATISIFTENNVPIHFISQGLITLDDQGKESSVATLVINILACVAQMEKNLIRERQIDGIALAKLKNVYKGRKLGSKEDTLKFLSKPKNKEALNYLKKGYSHRDVSTLTGIHYNTVTKIKKIALVEN